MKLNFFAYLISVPLIFVSCKKDTKTTPDEQPAQTGTVKVVFENRVNTADLVLNSVKYVTLNNDTFKVNILKYYISHIVLTKNDNTVFTEENSYHLVDQAIPSTMTLNLSNVPFGEYKSISYMIGVDSTKCCSGAQTGDLDPAKGMFWDWDTGYIMAYLGGTSPQSTGINNSIAFQTIGFMGAYNCIKYNTLSFSSTVANVTADRSPSIHISGDILEWFKSPNSINFATTNLAAAPGALVKQIADNYQDMFTIRQINN